MKVTDNNNKPNNEAVEGEKLIKKPADQELLLEERVDLDVEPIAVAMVEQLDLVLSENQSVVIADDIDDKNKKRKDKKEQLEQDNQEQTVKDSQSDIEQSNTAGEGAVEADPISEAEGEGEVAKALAEKQAAKGFGVYLSELSTQTLVLGSLGILGAATFFRHKEDVALPLEPIVGLVSDGGLAGDLISNNGDIVVSNLTLGAKWEYSTDNGVKWNLGSEFSNSETASFSLVKDGVYQILVRQTNSAGTVQTNSALVVTIETVAPDIDEIIPSAEDGTITLLFNEPLGNVKPLAADFKITQDTDLVAISNISINDSSVILTVEGLTNSALQILYTPSANPIQDVAGNSATGFAQMVVSDGYIRDAKVYIDTDNDGIADESELIPGLTSDALGQIVVSGDHGDGQIVVKGGVNVDSGAVNQFELTAPAGYTVINPLSTLVQEIVASDDSQTVEQAEDVLIATLGIKLGEGEDLSNYDPISDSSDNAIVNRVVTTQIATVLAFAAAADKADDSGDSKIEEAALKNLAAIVATSVKLTLNNDVIEGIFLDDLGNSLVDHLTKLTDAVNAMEVVKNSQDDPDFDLNTAIEEIVLAQAQLIDSEHPSAPVPALATESNSGISDSDNLTSITSPKITISLETMATNGMAVVAGDTVKIDINGNSEAYVLLDEDVENGSFSYDLQAVLADGINNLSVTAIDRADNESEYASSYTFEVDTTELVIDSSVTAAAIDENSGDSQVIYTATVEGDDLWKFELSQDSDPALSVDSLTGEITLTPDPDYETQSEFSFTIISYDNAGNQSEQSVTLDINNLDEVPPRFTSSNTASVVEGNESGDVVYTAVTEDKADFSSDVIEYSLLQGDLLDPILEIDQTTGEVTLNEAADYEAKTSYTFTVVATDTINKGVAQQVTLNVINVDESAPSISSAATTSIDENSVAGLVVYQAIADDSADVSEGVSFSLLDETLGFTIDSETGVVTTNNDFTADYESAQSQNFTVVASDVAGNSTEKQITVSINDIDESDPVITSGNTADSIDENSGAGQVVYSATSNEEDVLFSLSEETDATLFSINSTSGAVIFKRSPDYEDQSSFSFEVIATDAVGNISETQSVTLSINNVDDRAPEFTSSTVGNAIDENSGAGQVVYIAVADDSADISAGVTFSLSGSDADAFSIDSTSGAVTLDINPDYEAQSAYSFTVIADDGVNDAVEQSVTLEINEIDDAPPVPPADTAVAIDENTGADQIVYTATATGADFNGSEDLTFSLVDENLGFSIDADTGVVSTNADFAADYESAQSQSFTLVVTDATGNSSEQVVSVAINNLDEIAPTIVSGDTATAIDENSGAGQVVYTAIADDSADISAGVTFRLVEDNSSSKFAINKWNGEVTLLTSPDYEETESLSFTVVATDAAGNESQAQSVTLNINNLDEVPPTITSASAIAVQETYVDQDPDAQSQDLNIFVNEAVYQTTVDDSSDIPTHGATDITYALTDGSDPAINIDANTGEVTLDTSGLEFSYINQQAYTFGIVATDAANNVSDAHTVTLSVEEAKPREAIVEVTYSGVDGQPTSNGEIQVSNIKPGSTWEYSTDGGVNWESGTYDSDIDASAIGEGSFTIVGDGEYTVDVRVINAQDVSTALAAPIVVTVDTAPPAPQFVNADSESSIINVVYNESLDATYQPLSTDYSITQQGSELTVDTVQFVDGEDADGNLIANSVLQLTISEDTPFTAGALNFTYAASDNAGELVTDLAGNQLDQGFTQMIVSDGYIRDAKVYVDVNGDGIADADERRAEVTSDSYGQIILTDEFLSASENTDENGNPYRVIIKGGVNVDSGAPNEIELTAPAGYAVINPLSTLVQEIASSLEVEGATQAEKDAAKAAAEASVEEALGISLDEGSSLGSYDPQSDDNVANRVVATQIATVLAVASSTESAGAETAALASLADTITGADGTITLDKATLDEALDDVVDSDSLETIVTAIEAMEAVKNSQDDEDFDLNIAVEEIVLAQAIAIDIKAPKAPVPALATESNSGVSDSDNLTNDTSPEITISLDTTAIDGAAVVAGDMVKIEINDKSETYVLSEEDFENGSFSYYWQGVLTEGENYISAIAIDRADNESEYISTFRFEVDTTELVISSADTAEAIDENSGDNQVIYTATVDGDDFWKFELSEDSDSALTIDSVTGEVTLSANPDYEIQSQYSFSVTATDNAGNESAPQSVTLDINNLDEIVPSITSGDTATAIDENSGAGQVVYTATADDSLDITAGVTFSLSDSSDPALSIDPSTGEVTLSTDPDYETQSEYSFTVVASDGVNDAVEQSVTLDINNLDEIAPTITSGDTGSAVDENSGSGQVVYTATATDDADISAGFSFSLADEALGFSIDAATGVVTTNADFAANFEDAQSQSFTLVATDAAGNASEKLVSVAINNLDEVAPSITSGDTASAINENSGAGQVIYTATANDSLDISAGVTFSLSGVDADAFSIDSTSGAVTLTNNPDYETQSEYSFTVVASDGVNDAVEQSVTLDINNLDEIAPSITSGDTATAIDENSGAGQVVYTATADDSADTSDGVIFSLADDSLGFSIDAATGVVTTNADFAANYEDAQSQSFTVVATDVAGNASEQVVSVAINNLDEVAPSITSGDTATAIDENSDAGQVVYTATATDDADISDGVTFSLSGFDADAFSIDSTSGVVTLNTNPDYEVQSTYSFAVIATDAAGNESAPQSVTLDINNLDEVAPSITSGATAVAIDENSGAGQVIYTATADDSADTSEGVTFSLADDSLGFSIDAVTGVVTTNTDFAADYEDAQSQSFTVIATDATGNASAQQLVSVAINNLDEVAPSITSADKAVAIDENSGAGQVVYTATASDTDFNGAEDISFSLADDSLGFSIDADTGVVTTNDDFAADYEDAQSQSFTVVATDVAGNASAQQLLSVAINNLDEVAPTITSDASNTTSVNENSGAGQVVYTATASDTDFNGAQDITFSLADETLGFSIDADTGVVTTNADFAADYEDAQSQSLTVVATDATGNSSNQLVSVAINNLDDTAPIITSGDTAIAVNENSGAGQVVYTAIADDSADLADAPTSDNSSDTGSAVSTVTIPDLVETTQHVYVSSSTKSEDGTQETVVISYNAEDTTTTGLGIRVHFDSSAININDISDIFQNGFLLSSSDPVADDDNDDGDTNTDQFVTLAWASLFGSWPNSAPVDLATITFDVDEDATGTSAINFTASSNASGFDFDGQTHNLALTAAAPEGQTSSVEFSLADESLGFSIDSVTGVVTTNDDFAADHEDAQSQSFTVVAADAAGNESQQLVNVAINDLDDAAPTITSASIADTLDENSGSGQVVYTATADDSADDVSDTPITFSLSDSSDTALSIDPSTGAVTLSDDPDHEAQSSYSFAVIATDAAGNESQAQSVILEIKDLDDAAPTITSGDTAVTLDENSGAGQVVYTATAVDSLDDVADSPITFSLSDSSDTALSIDPSTGAVTLSDDPDHEAQSSYSFAVIATDAAGNESQAQSVILEIKDLDDAAPTITSGDTAVTLDENSGAGQVVYTATAVDSLDDVADSPITFSLSDSSDTALSIDPSTGAVTLSDDPDHEAQSSYSFAVIATDAAGNESQAQSVILEIKDLDDAAPTITSGDTAVTLDENSGAGQVVYTATAVDSLDDVADSPITFSLSDSSDTALSIDPSTGAVTLSDDPDHEAQSSYSFAVIATDAAGNESQAQSVILEIKDLDDAAPTITSGDTAVTLDENSGAGQVVYTATAVDSLDDVADSPITFSLSDSSDTALSIDPSTGAVTLSDDPDHEAQSSYSFAVIATDAAGNESQAQSVILEIKDLDDAAPTITSGDTAVTLDENSGAGQVVYTATAVDSLDDVADSPITFSLSDSSDTALSIDPSTGAVTLSDDPDHEAQSSYSFAVIATDAAGNESQAQSVILEIKDLDDAAPTITSGDTAVTLDENSGAGQVVYTATAVDSLDDVADSPITFSLSDSSDTALSIDPSTGAVTLSDDPDHEAQSSYSFAVIATDAAGNESQAQSVILEIKDLDDAAPTITSGDTAVTLDENSGAGQVVYTATAVDSLDDVADSPITFSLSDSSDTALSIDPSTGAVTLSDDPDHEAQSSYSFAVIATDAAGNESQAQSVILEIKDLDDAAPTITSGDTAVTLDENSGAGQVVYTATAVDSLDDVADSPITFSLSDSSDTALSIDPSTGAVTLSDDPDHEAQSSYSFAVIATDAAGNESQAQSVILEIKDLDDAAPTITSGDTAVTLDENSGAGQVVYTATAVDSLDDVADSPITFSLSDSSDTALSIDPSTGAVTLSDDPDHEAQSSYSFAVIATDAAGNESQAQSVILEIKDLDDAAPTITSGDTAVTLDENSGAGQVVYTATAVDSLDDVADSPITFSLSDSSDTALSIDPSTGAVTLSDDPDHEAQSSYSFAVIATDAAGNESQAQSVILEIKDLDDAAPTITSGDTAVTLDENSGAGQVVYTATAVDSLDDVADSPITFSLSDSSDTALSIDPSTGAVTLSDDPDHEAQSSYSFAVIATDAAGNESQAQSVILEIKDLDDAAPTITSGDTAVTLDENSGAGQVVYTATAVDSLDDVADSPITFSLSDSSDTALSIDPSTGAVTLSDDPDHEAQSSYSFAVIATDAAGNESQAQSVILEIKDLDDAAPTITSGDTAVTLDENSGAGQVVYTATAVDSLDDVADSPITFSLSDSSDTALSIDPSTGAVTLSDDPDHEAQSSYSFAVIATDAAGNESQAQSVILEIKDLDDAAPTITSGDTAVTLDENSGAGQVVYTATAVDSLDDVADSPITFSLSDSSDTALSIDPSTGAVTLSDDPDHEAQSSYSFAVIATDAAGNESQAQSVILEIKDLDDAAPTITSGDTAVTLDENSGAGQVVYTATAVDSLDDVADSPITFSLSDSSDTALSIDPSTGAVTLSDDPDHEAQSSYSFAVIATDAAGNESQAQSVILEIKDLDDAAPTITSGDTAVTLDENSGAGQVVYTATAVDSLDDVADSPITFSLSDSSDTALSIDPSTGAVTLSDDPDHEAQSSYSFAVIATDAAGNESQAQSVILEIKDLDDAAPTITSGDTAVTLDENSGAGQVVYTATAVDSLDDVADSPITFSLSDSSDTALSIDPSTGAVTLSDDPDHEAQSSYSFAVIATDAAGNESQAQSVILEIKDLDDAAPTITSGDTAVTLDENSGAGQVVYTATAVDSLDDVADSPITFSLSDSSDTALSIDPSTGAVTLSDDPDHEAQSSYSFAVIATDAAGNESQAQSVILEIKDLDDAAPTITSGDTAVTIDENSGAGQVVYTATAVDSLDDVADSPITFSLSDSSDTALSIDPSTGAVTLSDDPDHEAQSSYSFAVIATDGAGNASVTQSVTLDINNLDEVAPTITSGDTASAIDENSGAGQVVYTATASDTDFNGLKDITFSLSGVDAGSFTINEDSGAVTLIADPDHEAQSQYSFAVIATDGAGNASVAQSVTLDINNLDEVAPTITSGDTASAIDENSGAGQVVYTATASDTDFNGLKDITFSLSGVDAGSFTINEDSGAVTLIADPDHEAQSQYSFAVIATDGAGNASVAQSVTLDINNLDEVAPTITSGDTASAIDENSGAGQVVYTATASDTDFNGLKDITFSLSGVDAGSFTINEDSGAVTLIADPDHEAQSQYSFAVIATDAAGNESQAQSVILEINDLDDAAPTITSGDTAVTIDENSGAGQVVYTATADDSADDVSDTPITFSLSDSSDTALSIDPSTGAVTLSDDPDHEAQSSYSFAVIATDAAGNESQAQSVTLDINNLDEVAPSIDSGDTATAVDENTGEGQVVYTAIASDSDFNGLEDITFSLAGDSLGFSIDASTGVVTTNADFAADYENTGSQSFTVIATDATGNESVPQSVTLDINNLDEVAPTITSGEIATDINENSGAGQVVYIATAFDSLDDVADSPITFTLAEGSDASLSIDPITGEVTLSADPDHEAQSSYSFAVIATDAAGNESVPQSVTLSINDLDDAPPTITSTDNVIVIEGTGSNQVVYAATADDSGDDVSDTPIIFTLAEGSDPALTIDSSTGEVSLSTDPDHKEQSQYSFAVIATDAAGNASDSQLVTLRVAEVVSGSSASAIESGAIEQKFIQNSDGSITLQMFVSAAMATNYASGIGSIDLVLQYNSNFVGSIVADQILSPANPFDFMVNDDTENEIAVAQIYFPTAYNSSSEIPIIEVDFNFLEGFSSATFDVSSVIFGEDDVDSSSYEVSVATYEGTDNTDADVFALVDGVAHVNSGEGSDIFVVTEDTDANILIDFETGVDTLELGLLLDSAGYTGLSSSSDAAHGLAYQLSADTPDIVDLISDADDLLDNAFGGYLDDTTNVLTVFADINADADSDAITIKTMQVTLDQDSTINDEDIVATISAFIA
jgi:hypothetical protein